MAEALSGQIHADVTQALCLATAYFNAPDGAKLDDPTFVGLLAEALDEPRDAVVALTLLTHRLLNEAGEDADDLLARAGLLLAHEREGSR